MVRMRINVANHLMVRYIHSGIMLAFTPVFLESVFWMVAIFFSDEEGSQ